jgi:hypothetical protein
MDPKSKLLLTIDVGERTLAMAQCVVHQVALLLAPDGVPLFLPDGYKDYFTAILTHALPPNRAGCHGPGCSMPRSSRPCAAVV